MDIEELAANITAVYRSASDLDREQGAQWYALAHLFAVDIAGDAVRGAGVIAALSPQTSWDYNKRIAQRAMLGGTITGHTRPNTRKAALCRDGAAPLDVLGGNKVRAFYALILDPTNAWDVVIDRHAFDIACGFVTDDRTRKAGLERKGGYEHIADAYRKAAANLGVLPHVLQATTWLAWRRSKWSSGSTFAAF